MGEAGRQQRLPDPAQPEHGDHPTPLVEHPLPQHLTLGRAAHEPDDVRGLAPGRSPCPAGSAQEMALAQPRRCAVSPWTGPVAVGDDLVEPGAVEGSPESRRLAGRGRPQRRRLVRLPPRGEAAVPRASRDERLQARHARVVGPGFPSLDGVHVDAHLRRQLALGQVDPPAQLQQEATKALARRGQAVAR